MRPLKSGKQRCAEIRQAARQEVRPLVRLGHFADVSRTNPAGADGERARSDRPSRSRSYGDRGNEDVSRQMPGWFGGSNPQSDQVVLGAVTSATAEFEGHSAKARASDVRTHTAAFETNVGKRPYHRMAKGFGCKSSDKFLRDSNRLCRFQ